jgi:hypothetical protein
MSIRAYKIEKVVYGDCRLNLYCDEKIMRWLDHIGATQSLNADGAGNICVMKADAQAALKSKKWKFDKEDKKILKAIIKDCGKSDCVDYSCF